MKHFYIALGLLISLNAHAYLSPSYSTATGTNTGDISLSAVGSSANANGASLTGQALNLQPASGSFPGVVTTAAQTLAGAKAFTDGLSVGGGATVLKVLSASAALDFPSVATQDSADLTINVTGASVGDPVMISLSAPTAGMVFNGFVSSSGVVTIRASNVTVSSIDLASATYRVVVFHF